MGLVIGDDVSKITLGDQVLYDRDKVWHQLDLSDGVTGTIVSKVDRSQSTVHLLGSLFVPANVSGVINSGNEFKFNLPSGLGIFGSENSFSGPNVATSVSSDNGNLVFATSKYALAFRISSVYPVSII